VSSFVTHRANYIQTRIRLDIFSKIHIVLLNKNKEFPEKNTELFLSGVQSTADVLQTDM